MTAPQPPAPPQSNDVRVSLEQLDKLENGANSQLGTVTAVQVATAGYTLVETQCGAFFSAVYKWSNDTSFNRKETALVGAAAAGVLAAVSATATAIAVTAIGFGLAANSLDNFQNYALFTPKPESVSKLVSQAIATYRQAAPPDDDAIMTDIPTAQAYVSGYADLCTYHRIQEFVDQAIAAAIPVVKNAGSTSIFSSDEQTQLAFVNAELGLSNVLLSDAKYEELYWYFKSANTNDANRTKVLNDFSTIQASLWDSTNKTLPQRAQRAAALLSQIAANNPALTKAETDLEASNKPASPAAAAAGIVPPPVRGASRSRPFIEIKTR